MMLLSLENDLVAAVPQGDLDISPLCSIAMYED